MLPWYSLAMFGALLAGISVVVGKYTLFKEHALEFATTLALINALMVSPLLLVVDYSAIPPFAYALMAFVAAIATTAYLLMTKALRHSPVSLTAPFTAIVPAVTALFAWFFLRESLTIVQLSGLLLLVVGLFVLQHKPGVSLLSNVRMMWVQKYTRYMVIAMVLYGLAGVIDRFIVGQGYLGISTIDYLAIVHVIIAAMFFFLLHHFHDGFRGVRHGLKTAWAPILVLAVLTLVYRFFGVLATADPAGQAALVSGIRRSSAFFATIIGGEMFHEKHLLRRVFACCIIIGGVLLMLV